MTATPLKNQAQAWRLDQMPLEEVRPGFARTGIRTEASINTVSWFEPGFKTRGPHSHPFDQLSYVLAGAMRFWVGDQVFDLVAPSVLYIPGGAPHCAEPLGTERALNVDVFAPLREDYLPLCDHQGFQP
jgi:mannose-6-phosphate isomerase-like protein (cupin superfamily)